ncbi:NAD(P)H-dependent flavin oxidoreductase [Natranaerobius trueperi]|uniref:Probable nitronate monooxygenase n=1 Tax=Natranaerobius trueperi TaxID=759412 RepID=A0A226BYD7_9FIRM|nr:nitronate monooxygenase family protein [Natranaerobius trueperi]OWZ83782.1 nitronate monooxygenase [Natranaerobius trueperi]
MSLSKLKIADLEAKLPIVQGAMGVGISLSNLASTVANAGAVGMIAGVQIGYSEPDFEENPKEANIRALKKHIRKAKSLSPEGVIGVNLLTAINNYADMVRASVEEKVDLIVSGAGFPKNLPDLVKGSDTKIAPIVSSGKGAQLISKIWDRRYNRVPDMVIIEGPEAGGHLGFTVEDLKNPPSLENLVPETIENLAPFEEKYNKKIPVVAAGGIYNGKDIKKYLELGASGVQMATRFVTTKECDASEEFKKTYVNSAKEDIQLVKSPVGMPGRAINNQFINKLKEEDIPINKCYNCLRPCDPSSSSYCISDALVNSCIGDVDNGLIFCGTNAYRAEKITTVKDVINELVAEATNYNNVVSN